MDLLEAYLAVSFVGNEGRSWNEMERLRAIVVVDDRCARRLAKFLEIEAPSQINPGTCRCMRVIRTCMEEREWTSKQGNGIVTNRIIINIGETSKQRDQCFSGIEVDKLITTSQYNGSREEWRSAGGGMGRSRKKCWTPGRNRRT